MIIEVGNTLISTEIFSVNFVCHLEKCKGACCVEGDRGAPLEKEEILMIEKNIEAIKTFMSYDGLELLASEGFHEGEEIDDIATTCLPTGECVFAYSQNGILGCAMEKTFREGMSDFYKPISCHLYPVRIGKVGEMESVGYHEWDICKAACSLGNELNVPVYRFLKEPLIRKYGEDWYDELEVIYEEFKNFKKD
jgi:hypothetical protein